MISREQIQEFSKRLAIDEFTVIREYIQIVFLSILYSAKESQKIYFKGGTAIRLLLRSGRFSEDLDFTAELGATELDEIVSGTVKKVSFVVPGLTLKRTSEGRCSYILYYQTEDMKHPLTIDVDFSLREHPETSHVTVLETDFPVAPQPIIKHLDWPEVLAEKIRAFLTRPKDHKRGRDIYDLWFLLSKGVDLDWKMVNRKTSMYDIKTSSEDLLKKVGEFDAGKLKNDLGKFLPVHDRALIEHLKELTTKQIVSRESFTIRTSENIEYSKVPGFLLPSRAEHTMDTKRMFIVSLERQDENSIKANLQNEQGNSGSGYIRARTKNGVRELDVIEVDASLLKGQSYDDLLSYQFTS
ncbi:MAG TPA: nucleotidyl transferase AbiEii/AbiGii toxin family protein [Candidatus Paceibacterota bacterium]